MVPKDTKTSARANGVAVTKPRPRRAVVVVVLAASMAFLVLALMAVLPWRTGRSQDSVETHTTPTPTPESASSDNRPSQGASPGAPKEGRALRTGRSPKVAVPHSDPTSTALRGREERLRLLHKWPAFRTPPGTEIVRLLGHYAIDASAAPDAYTAAWELAWLKRKCETEDARDVLGLNLLRETRQREWTDLLRSRHGLESAELIEEIFALEPTSPPGPEGLSLLRDPPPSPAETE